MARKLLIGAIAVVVLAAFSVWVFEYFSVQKPLQRVLADDSRNKTVQAKAGFGGWFDFNTLVFSVNDVAGSATRMDVFRIFLQYAEAMKEKRFTTVVLAYRGKKKFTLEGSYFRTLGEEYKSQNPMYTIRTFPIHLTTMEGIKPYSEYTGGILGVLKKEMEQFNDFNDSWYLRDLATSSSSAPPSTESKPASPSASVTSDVPSTKPEDWYLSESKNQMDNTPIVSLSRSGSNGARLIIRCAGRKTDAYVNTSVILDTGSVRVRFDDGSPVRQSWGKSTDDEALFAPDAIAFTRQLAKAHTFLLEFTPFRKTAQTVSFDVTGLDHNMEKISTACNWEAIDKSRAKAKAAEASLRRRIEPYVHQCKVYSGGWCYTDPDQADDERYGGASKEDALMAAMDSARYGTGFKSLK